MLIHYIFARRGEKYSCYSPTYARFASILRPFMCNTLHLLNKIQTTLDSDFKCNTSVLVVGTDSRIKHLAFRSQVFFLVGGSTHLE
ncbi:hypothetical protein ACY2C2_10105, partial [Neisseria meningitidis]